MKSDDWRNRCIPQIVFTDEFDDPLGENSLPCNTVSKSVNDFLDYGATTKHNGANDGINICPEVKADLLNLPDANNNEYITMTTGKKKQFYGSMDSLNVIAQNYQSDSSMYNSLNDLRSTTKKLDNGDKETDTADGKGTFRKINSPFNIKKIFTTKQERSHSNDLYLTINKSKNSERRFSGPAALFNLTSEKSWKEATKAIGKENLRVSNIIKYIKKKNWKKLKTNLTQIKSQEEFKMIKNALPIHEASFHGNCKAILLLSQFGFDLTETDHFHWTILHAAILGEEYDTVKYILKHADIDVNAVTIDGKSPLHVAIFLNNYEITKLLLEQNANPLLYSNLIETPFQIAVDLKRTNIIDLLLLDKTFLVKK